MILKELSRSSHSTLSFYRQLSRSPKRYYRGSASTPFLYPCHLALVPEPTAPPFHPLGKDGGTVVLSEAMQPVSEALFIPGCIGDSKYLWKVINGLFFFSWHLLMQKILDSNQFNLDSRNCYFFSTWLILMIFFKSPEAYLRL